MSSLRRKYSSTQTTFYRHGAEAARGAHNPEVTRSKRVVGIIIKSHRCIKALEQSPRTPSNTQDHKTHTGVAQRKRAVNIVFYLLDI